MENATAAISESGRMSELAMHSIEHSVKKVSLSGEGNLWLLSLSLFGKRGLII